MVNDIHYGRALYYPYINFSDIAWLKSAALYYEGIDRIVPEGYSQFTDSDIVNKLNEHEGFIKNINPKPYAKETAFQFLDFTESVLRDDEKVQSYRKMFNKDILGSPISIHSGKVAYMLRRRLVDYGLATKIENNDFSEWMTFEPVTGAMYMTFLANFIAKERLLPVVSDDLLYQQFLFTAQEDSYPMRPDTGEMMAAMVIQSIIPENIENIPISKILEFRKNHNDERFAFYNEINNLTNDLRTLNNSDLLKECLEYRRRGIDIAVKNLEKAFSGMKIATATAMLGLSIPTFATGLGAIVGAVGLIAVAIGTLTTQVSSYQKARSESPYAYLLSLKNNLKSETLAKEMITGKLIL